MVEALKETFKNRRVLVTGHTGFKGVWLMEMLEFLGAETFGYSLLPESTQNHHRIIGKTYNELIADICDLEKLQHAIASFNPDVILHLAAQSLVRKSYVDPLLTYQTNVMGSLNVLKASASAQNLRAILMVTTDKVYENLETDYAYREGDRLGGYDMYSSSKACCEILIDSYRRSYLPLAEYGHNHQILLASARAGNVIGGGDWNRDRLIPDLILSAVNHASVPIRNPHAIRPWQHVMDCLYGYLLLTRRMLLADKSVSGAWNFSPSSEDVLTVIQIAEKCAEIWNEVKFHIELKDDHPHEAKILKLDPGKATSHLSWKPIFHSSDTILQTVQWYKSWYNQNECLTMAQIESYFNCQDK
ncbi:MAG: CDP-glucose 4,6-dehydratase [Saprospiraceae bacterium]|nr:CDP-glucose 4,6-dehydratase [Saprospiraceae bacterium]